MAATPDQLADGLWRWTARHPEWHPGEFGAEVASFALQAGDDAILIDPLLPPEPGPVLELIDELVGDRLAILITIPYHVRSSEELWRRYRERADTSIRGHPAAAKRLEDRSAFREVEPGSELPAGVSAHAIGKPRRHEMPFYLPSHKALAFGDAVVEVDGELKVWATDLIDEQKIRFHRGRFNPTLEPLLEVDLEGVLVTHGKPILGGAREALGKALRAKPWHRHGER